MNHTERTFAGHGGVELHLQSWRPADEPRAVLVVVHGLGEHGGRHTNLIEHLVPRGFVAYAPDMRGFGRSPGKRGHINSFAEFRQDVDALLELAHSEWPQLPLFLYGQSLGGVIVLDVGLRRPEGVAALIASSPALGEPDLSPVLLSLARVLDRVWPSLPMNSDLDSSTLSRDPAVAAAYNADPLVHRQGSPRLATETFSVVDWLHDNAGRLRVPLYVLVGSEDKLVDPEGCRQFVQATRQDLVTFVEYEGGYHELFNDIIKEQVLDDLTIWLEEQLATTP